MIYQDDIIEYINRAKKELTWNDLVKIFGFSKSTLRNWQLSKTKISTKSLLKINKIDISSRVINEIEIKHISIETQKEIMNYVKKLLGLGYSKSVVAEIFTVSPNTIQNWVKHKTKPSDKMILFYNTFNEDLIIKKVFFSEIKEKEAKRIYKEGKKYIGEYVTIDNREVYKFVWNKLFYDEKDFYHFLIDMANKSIKYFDSKGYRFYYVGVFIYYLDVNGITHSFGIQSTIWSYLEGALEDFTTKIEGLFSQNYVEFWVITQIWIAGFKYLE